MEILRDEVLDVIRTAALAGEPLDLSLGGTSIKMSISPGSFRNGKVSSASAADSPDGPCLKTRLETIRTQIEEYKASLAS